MLKQLAQNFSIQRDKEANALTKWTFGWNNKLIIFGLK